MLKQWQRQHHCNPGQDYINPSPKNTSAIKKGKDHCLGILDITIQSQFIYRTSKTVYFNSHNIIK
ncbi:hypothetical protein BANRA_01490 [Klebsiella pneumoniae]|nr:hypothetical protein BANRA_01490 [Klebsiella pneumoniae]